MSDARRTAEAYADVDPEKFGARPQRRTRPRTKDRPDYSAAEIARVLTVDRGRFRCQLIDSGVLISAAKARQLGRKGVIVGDLVRVVGDTSGEVGTLARIVEVVPRTTESSISTSFLPWIIARLALCFSFTPRWRIWSPGWMKVRPT